MSDRIFPILGSEDVPLVGRAQVLQRVWSDLTKTTPTNRSVVGPRYIGKTVLLKALAQRAKQLDSPYALVLYWELGHAPPKSDDLFIAALSDLLRKAMDAASGDFSEHREYLDKSYTVFKEVTDLLDSEGRPILMIWDGLDKPLGQGLLTGHLFGQLRDLFHGKRHKIVTAARASPSELARNKQVYDSEFWNLFDPNPVRIGTFDEADVAAAVAKAAITISPGGTKQLKSWAQGHPLLLLMLLNRLVGKEQNTPITDEDVNTAAKLALEDIGENLTILWENDCTPSARNLYGLLVERGEVLAAGIGKDDVQCLVSQGFAERDGNKLKPACRLLRAHVETSLPDAGTLARLFETWDSYRREIRSVLELRLKQIPAFNERLQRLVKKSIEDIPDFPDDCLNSLSQIEEQALDLIWDRELGASRQIPNEVVAYWTMDPRTKVRLVKERMEQDSPRFNDWRMPTSRSDQVGFLQLLTGSRGDFDYKAQRVSKDAYVLINAIHTFRNRNEHPEGQKIHEGVAVAAMMTCVELLACLAREFA